VEDALSVLMHLMNSGMRVPKQVSVISGMDAPFLRCSVPCLARYAYDWADYARRAARMVTQLIETGHLPARAVRLVPKFKEGKTLAPPPS
jgi:DNA-binding LacI/PurR family transcriptional regulator